MNLIAKPFALTGLCIVLRFGAPLADEIKSQLLSAGQSCQSGETLRAPPAPPSASGVADVALLECQRHKTHKVPELRKSSKSLSMKAAVECCECMYVRQARLVVLLNAILA